MPDGAAPDDPVAAAPLLALAQWLSPGFPVGAYAYSHGLEWAIAAGEVADAAALGAWLGDVIARGAGRTDAILLAAALRGAADHDALGALAAALAGSAERWRETAEQGAAFAAAVGAVTGRAAAPRAYPVAVGAAARGLGLPARLVVALYLQAFAANLVGAGVRFVPLGQSEGQRVLAGLRPLIEAVAADAVAGAAAPLEALGSAAIGAEMAAMRHETMQTRVFRT